MYTFQPLPIPTHDWIGGAVASVLFGVIIAFVGFILYRENETDYTHLAAAKELARRKYNRRLIAIIIAAVALETAGIFALIGSSELKIPKNEKVVGVLKQYMPSGYEYKSGKTTHFKNAIFGLYEVPEGEVIMELRPGMFSPERVVMYKN